MWHLITALRSRRWIRIWRMLLVCWSLWVVSFGAYSRRFLSDGTTDSDASIIEKSMEDNAMNINKGNLSSGNRKYVSAIQEKNSNNDLKNICENFENILACEEFWHKLRLSLPQKIYLLYSLGRSLRPAVTQGTE